jgi:type I restriction enzyme R subunit
VESSPTLRNKKDLIQQFVDSLTITSDVDMEWRDFVSARRDHELTGIIDEEGLDGDATRVFIEAAFREGGIQPTGTAVAKILRQFPRFGNADGYAGKKQVVLQKLLVFYDRFIGLNENTNF